MKIIATYNLKGGVGKTSTAVNMAYLAAKDGYRTLLWDLDPQGAASFCFRVKPKLKGGIEALRSQRRSLDDVVKATDFTGLDLIPADFSFRNFDQVFSDTKKPSKQLLKLLFPISREYDLLFIDCAPSISLASENIFYAADALLIPLIPTHFFGAHIQSAVDLFQQGTGKTSQAAAFFLNVRQAQAAASSDHGISSQRVQGHAQHANPLLQERGTYGYSAGTCGQFCTAQQSGSCLYQTLAGGAE